MGVGESDCEGEAGEAGTGTDVGDPLGRRKLRDLEAGEAVGDVDLPGALVDHGADRGTLRGEQLEDLAQGLAAGRVEHRGGVRAHSATRGATMTQRLGSSPSL